jgi:ribosomal protein L37AE/L43A
MTTIKLKGQCEICDTEDVKVTLCFGNMWLCDGCKAEEDKVASENTVVTAMNYTDILNKSRELDHKVELKQDIFVAKLTKSVELKAAIFADETLTDEQKQTKFAEACFERFQHLKSVVFDDRAKLNEDENEMRMWQSETQQAALNLKADERAKYQAVSPMYKPEKVKKIKSSERTKSDTPKVVKLSEIDEALKKVGLELNATNRSAVKATIVGDPKNQTADTAATWLKSLFDLKKKTS